LEKIIETKAEKQLQH